MLDFHGNVNWLIKPPECITVFGSGNWGDFHGIFWTDLSAFGSPMKYNLMVYFIPGDITWMVYCMIWMVCRVGIQGAITVTGLSRCVADLEKKTHVSPSQVLKVYDVSVACSGKIWFVFLLVNSFCCWFIACLSNCRSRPIFVALHIVFHLKRSDEILPSPPSSSHSTLHNISTWGMGRVIPAVHVVVHPGYPLVI